VEVIFDYPTTDEYRLADEFPGMKVSREAGV
jgi:hypothetical protein